MSQHSQPITTDDDDPEFIDALEDFIFSQDSAIQDSVSKTPDPICVPLSTGIRRRRLLSRQNSKEFRLKNTTLHESNVIPTKDYNILLNSMEKRLSKVTALNSQLNKEADLNTSSVSILTEAGMVNDNLSATVGSGLNLIFTLMWLIIKVISLTHECCMVVTNPFDAMARAKGQVMGSVLRLLKLCLGYMKRVVYGLVRRNKYVWRLCVQVGWGLLCSVFVGMVLVCLLVVAFVVGGVVMRCVVEAPVRKVARLSFDYSRDAPMAFVPLVSCSGGDCLGCAGKTGYGDVGLLRFVPLDRKLRLTVSLTLPESGYNRNLGNFQVKVEYLSNNGKSLASATQPCTMRFKSQPIRLLMMVFKLAPLITGYSSESQTVDIKFNGYTERKIPTSCVKVVLEPRAEFAKGGGVPEIYTASLKLESQLPFLKHVLWSWKATVFVWTSMVIFILVLVFVLLCCAPWLKLRGNTPLNNTGSR